jgi:hypothetical protein
MAAVAPKGRVARGTLVLVIVSTIFLLSPANLSGKRGRMLLNASAEFDLARALRSPAGAPLEQAFSFVSGLYFRGKAEYARRFGRALAGTPSGFVMTAGGGLCSLDETITKTRLEAWQRVAVSEQNPHFTAPLQRHACELLDAHGPSARFVLLGSVATRKYVAPLLEVFGSSLLYPRRFAGLGDMSRGSLLLRAVADGTELDYESLAAAADARRPTLDE